MNLAVLSALLFGLAANIAMAQPIVLADFGGKPLPWTQDLHAGSVPPIPLKRIQFTPAYPIRTVGMRPGSVHKKVLPTAAAMPIFVVGYDSQSFAWLHHNKQHLLNTGAHGFVVNVATSQQFARLQEYAAPITLSPVNGDDFHQHLGLTRYPFLIIGNEVMQ
ncbi:PFL_4695 family integrating conjugative element protein [Cellvibrio sp. ARAG 10.3]|uniref:PFL_4695 family integrating conjugative element protein n=1 Tax=Cellvibrio sp. ARAG 10.3 TaxID=3451358 RepID=UPI003F447066